MAVRLSVVVPVYGTEKYLRKCLESLRQQTMQEAEFILVNDCTPDRADRIMSEYAARDSRFRILRHESNRGLYAARLTGARAAQGEYIAFLDSDDYVSVDFYRHAVQCADDGGYDVVMGDTVWVEADGSRIVRPMHDACVPEEELLGRAVREAFYQQELSCYSWHTIWNKIYRRSLFMRCMPALERLTAHIIMTEDVAFSCVLLYEAQSLRRIRGDGVFYCTHAASSTQSAYADAARFFKNYGDIVAVFEFVEGFLREKNDEAALAHLMNARRWYCRMWAQARRKCTFDQELNARADALTARLAPGFDVGELTDNTEIWWFDQHKVPWNDGLEKIKRAIAGLEGYTPETVSFDVFDTLLLRPFRQPSDLRCLLEDKWQKTNRRCLISFADIRAEAETSARAWMRGEKEDIGLHDIYSAMKEVFGVSEDCALTMCCAEKEAEIAFCQPRYSGVQLYQLAKALGRRIVLTSDMYLDRETITAMLHKCGVDDWDDFFLSSERNALKWDSGLYRVLLHDLKVPRDTILHIGDNWENDFIQPRKLGMHAMHHPRAMDVFTDSRRTQLGTLGLQTAASFGGAKSLQASLPLRCMQALAAARFFDNGFAAASEGNCFASSPERLGYYAVGGHVLSVVQWLIRRAKEEGVRKLVFLARDGWLIRQAVDLLLTDEDGLTTDYQPASRRCLLPALTVNPTDFYALPINVPSYTVGKLMELLTFCTADLPQEALREKAESAGFAWDEPFPGHYRFLEFIRWFLENLYDGTRHQKAYNDLQAYYGPILTEGTACFDMGYSGRLQAALNQLAGRSVPVYFIHSDERECPRLERAYEFEARCFYGMKPGMSGAFREFLLSSDEAPCIGFRRTDTGAEPVYGKSEYNAAARFFLHAVQRNALRFVRDYMQIFGGTEAEKVNPYICSMPFESVLRYPAEGDLAMMQGIRFEDTVFAGREDLDLAELIRVQSKAADADGQDMLAAMRVTHVPEKLSVRKLCRLLVHDRGTLKAAAKARMQGHPRMMAVCRAGWRGLRRCRRILRREAV